MSETELFEIKNALYIGNYQHCINEAQKIQSRDDALKLQRDVLIQRALLGQRKLGVVAAQVRDGAAAPLMACKLLAKFLQSPDTQSGSVEALEALVSSAAVSGDATVPLCCAAAHAHQANWEAALRVLSQREELECRAQMVHCLLAIHRPDVARKELAKMAESDGDATLTELATAWLHVATGGDKLQDAYYIYQELMDKYTPTATLLAGQAACFLGQGRLEEAEAALQEATEKDPHCPDTLAGLMVWAGRAGKPEEESVRYMEQLKDAHKHHVIVKGLVEREADFDRVAALYAPSVAS